MKTGVVKWFNAKKRFGFIAPDSGNKDIFLHITALESAGINHIADGQKVQYEIDKNNGKESAINISLIN